MDAIGTEVGQKMRSAIKAKLMELGCYVDDELPDYIMVMVANKRSKTQMEDDLQLFLRSDTKVFVEWLHQVLKKLKEVTITNPEMYACSSFKELKRKATMEIVECVIKKEKKDKKQKPEKKTRNVELVPEVKSLTDEIPVQAMQLVEKRNQNNRLKEKADMGETSTENLGNLLGSSVVQEDNFDIPSLAEVNDLEESELDLVENKIKEARNRIVLMKSDSEDDDFINIRADAEELLTGELDGNISTNPVAEEQPVPNNQRVIKLKRQSCDGSEQTEKIAETENKTTPVKLSLSERLGVRQTDPEENTQKSKTPQSLQLKRTRISLTETLQEEKEISGKIKSSIQSMVKKPAENKIQKRENVHKRLGVPSSVVSLQKGAETPPEEPPKSVMSVVKVKPRRLISGPCQPNKNLLLKAVAEAQKSVTQAPIRRSPNKEALFTKKYREKHHLDSEDTKLNEADNCKVQNIIIEVKSQESKMANSVPLDKINSQYSAKDQDSNADDNDFVPSAIDLTLDEDLDKYIEDFDVSNETSDEEKQTEIKTNHQFIVTLDGLKDKKIIKDDDDEIAESTDEPVKPIRKAPSPIVFEKEEKSELVKSSSQIPELLPKVRLPLSVKNKDRCKYWPNCRLKDACEFIHPNAPCKMFPLCKFGDRCLYIHPKCKFDASCTRKDCPYSHGGPKTPLKTVSRVVTSYHSGGVQDQCKYFPNCSNPHCQFYHPKPCRFGKFCLNKSECVFSHGNIPNKEKLTWHSNIR